MNVKKSVDVAIIGGGIGGIMTAYRLLDKNPEYPLWLSKEAMKSANVSVRCLQKRQTTALNVQLVQ